MDSRPNFGKTAEDYSKYRQGFPPEFFERLKKWGIGLSEQKILDLGTGTGTIARGLALLGCNVIGINPSAELIEQAQQLDQRQNLNIQYVLATAEETLQPDHTFDVVVVGQAWHWFDAIKAIAEVKRILKPEGKLVIAHYDWLPIHDSVPALSETLILKYNPDWNLSGTNGFYPTWVTQLVEAGFDQVETYSFDVEALYSHEAWRGRIRASAGIAASLSKEKVAEFDKEHAKQLTEHFPEDPLYILHRCFTIIANPPTLFKPRKNKQQASSSTLKITTP